MASRLLGRDVQGLGSLCHCGNKWQVMVALSTLRVPVPVGIINMFSRNSWNERRPCGHNSALHCFVVGDPLMWRERRCGHISRATFSIGQH